VSILSRPSGLPLVQVNNVSMQFGGITAIRNLSFTIAERSITGLIGPNGSGKTTFFNILSGMYTPSAGMILLRGENIAGMKPHMISQRGIARTFQITRLFPQMTVLDNMLIAQKHQTGERFWFGLLNPPSVRAQEQEFEKKALNLLEYVGLSRMKDERAGNLSYGQQKLLELGRAVMAGPDLLLLDEPFAGVNPTLIERLSTLILELNRDRGLTIVLIEHMMKIIMRLAEVIIVLNHGERIAEGTPGEVQQDDAAIKAYLGV
jgi:branched-chain amino acid transport system ATP-binding protein